MSAPSVHADAPPEVVVDPEGLQYETGPQLGKGGFAICHRAKLMGPEHRNTKPIALKIVKSKMEPPKLAQKFVTELQIHSKLAHPNIVEFYRAFSFQSSTFVVLEICSNGSLADAIKKRKYFTMPEIRRFMIQTCGAIKYLHQRNIVHRDLKTGNLFLDEDMNVKVGDFGLAALLVSQSDFGAIRRTTMCGTPNYLAPEVLEKTGKGHDEKVDLWAIGIMMYTLAVGRAPFHAAKREDIYRRLKAREYTWPDLAKFPNEITDDLRDIVSLLLVHEDERPTPDQIVSHSFFRLGHVPLQLESACTSRVPKWPKIRPPTAADIKKGYTEEWYKMCKSSAVGEYEPGKTFGAYGSRRNKTVARDCQKEIESGKQPNIPFAKDTVYLPFPERTHWPFRPTNGLSEISEDREPSAEGRALVETTGNDRPSTERNVRTARRAEAMPTLKENKEPIRKIQEVETVRRGADKEPVMRVTEKPPTRMRSVRKISNPDRATVASAPLRVPRHVRTVQRAKTTKELIQETAEPLPEVLPLRVAKPVSRAVERANSTISQPSAGLRVLGEEAPSSDPAAVLKQLYTFKENVTRALQKQPFNTPRAKNPQLPFVAKWVDYSRKHGVGYVLEDGTVGCLATATDQHPVTMAFCPNGNSYLKLLAKDSEYMPQIPIEYYASPTPRKPLTRVEVTDANRSKVMRTIWSKFGKYMCVQLGLDDASRLNLPDRPNFVRFYQRLGNVGIWGFVDGAFQVNFPDHTKLVISSDAGYCNFTCLSLEATSRFRKTGEIAWKCIKEREVLQGSPQRLLYGPAGKPDIYKEIADGNGLRMKLEFIESVFEGWIQGGGLGCLLDPTTYTWTGPQSEENKKEDWVSVGRFGGDVL